jgi:DNA-binding response OmpR family regulator
MKKLLTIEDKSKRKFFLKVFLKIFNYETYLIPVQEMKDFIRTEEPDFVYLNMKEPADGEDLNELISNVRSDHRLRVRIINLSDHKLKFSYWFPFEFFDSIANSIHEKVYKKIYTLVIKK